jgi:aminopeptidase
MSTHRQKCIRSFIVTTLLLVLALPVRAADKKAPAPTPTASAALAEKLVGQIAGIQKDELVQISGSVADLPLLENLAVAVRQRGAYPLISLSSGPLTRRMFDEVSPQYDSQLPQFDLKLADVVNAQILVELPDVEPALAGVPAARLAAYYKALTAPFKRALERNVRMVSLGNGLYPTAARAALFGMSEVALRKVYNQALNVDYAQMQATAARLKGILASGKQMRITAPEGTDLTLNIAGQFIGTSDGIITPGKRQQGGTACQVWLPAGEVYLRPAADSAEGKVVFDHFYMEGKDFRNLALTIKAGKLTGMVADTGLDRLKELYAAAPAGKERLSVVDLGINPSIRLASGSRLRSWIPAGTITIVTGDDAWAGGNLDIGFGLAGQLVRGTLTVDGRTLIDKGQLKLE